MQSRVSLGPTIGAFSLTRQGFLFYSIRFMDKYPPGVMPSDARRSSNSTRCRFRKASGHDGAFDDHVWCTTYMRLMLIRGSNNERCQAIYHLDPADSSTAEGLRVLLTRDDDAPAELKGYTGLDKLIFHTIYIVNWTWTVFLNEAGSHLKILVSVVTILLRTIANITE
jgi:hypothetical protein